MVDSPVSIETIQASIYEDMIIREPCLMLTKPAEENASAEVNLAQLGMIMQSNNETSISNVIKTYLGMNSSLIYWVISKFGKR